MNGVLMAREPSLLYLSTYTLYPMRHKFPTQYLGSSIGALLLLAENPQFLLMPHSVMSHSVLNPLNDSVLNVK